MATYLSPDCPYCGNPPRLIIGPTQALCGADDCVCFMWNPSQTPAANLADPGEIDIEDLT